MSAISPNLRFELRIHALIGDVVEDNNEQSFLDIFDNTVKEVITLLPASLVVSRGNYSVSNGNQFVLTNDTAIDLDGKVFIYGERLGGSTLKRKEKLSLVYINDIAAQGVNDPESIYQATAGSPVGLMDGDTFKVVPASTATAKTNIYCFDAGYNQSSSVVLGATDIGYLPGLTPAQGGGKGYYAHIINGFPVEANDALVYKACANLLAGYIGEAVQEDEDSEILQLVTAQIKMFEGKFGIEMGRLGAKQEEKVDV